MSVRTYAILGNEYDAPVVKVPKRKAAPIMTEHRQASVAESLDRTRLEEIHREAQEAAARILADFEVKRGRK